MSLRSLQTDLLDSVSRHEIYPSADLVGTAEVRPCQLARVVPVRLEHVDTRPMKSGTFAISGFDTVQKPVHALQFSCFPTWPMVLIALPFQIDGRPHANASHAVTPQQPFQQRSQIERWPARRPARPPARS